MNEFLVQSLLVVAAFGTSTLSAIAGMGGGVLLISLFPVFLPAATVVPIHGAVQFVSNVSRGTFARRDIQWRLVIPFLLGALPGMALGSRLVISVPERLLPVLLGGFLLTVTWTPPLKGRSDLPGKFFGLGFGHAFLTLFVGATGPLNIPFLHREGLPRDRLIATQALLMTVIHGGKILIFGMLGFAFRDYAFLTAGMILAVIAGSFAGTRLRSRIPENRFRALCKAAVTLLAIRMIFRAIF